jgi:hypothetical protein
MTKNQCFLTVLIQVYKFTIRQVDEHELSFMDLLTGS